MTTLAIISDIHGNMHALRAVQADLARIAPDVIIVNGDSVGRGPQGSGVIDEIRQQGWRSTLGNHEAHWLELHRGDLPEDWTDSWWTPTRQQVETMGNSDFDWMASLPTKIVVEVPGCLPVHILHGSANGLAVGLYPDMDEQALLDAVGDTPQAVVVGAHTHAVMERHAGPYHILNSGSVGAPFNGNTCAQYVLLTAKDGKWHATFRYIPYDVTAALQDWQETGYTDSGTAARIFAHELETATFHFWHYVRFCDGFALDINNVDSIRRYLDIFPDFVRYCHEHDLAVNDPANISAYRHNITANPA